MNRWLPFRSYSINGILKVCILREFWTQKCSASPRSISNLTWTIPLRAVKKPLWDIGGAVVGEEGEGKGCMREAGALRQCNAWMCMCMLNDDITRVLEQAISSHRIESMITNGQFWEDGYVRPSSLSDTSNKPRQGSLRDSRTWKSFPASGNLGTTYFLDFRS